MKKVEKIIVLLASIYLFVYYFKVWLVLTLLTLPKLIAYIYLIINTPKKISIEELIKFKDSIEGLNWYCKQRMLISFIKDNNINIHPLFIIGLIEYPIYLLIKKSFC